MSVGQGSEQNEAKTQGNNPPLLIGNSTELKQDDLKRKLVNEINQVSEFIKNPKLLRQVHAIGETLHASGIQSPIVSPIVSNLNTSQPNPSEPKIQKT